MHWLIDSLIIICGAPILALLVCVCAALRLSGNISRDEEARETRASFDRLKRVA